MVEAAPRSTLVMAEPDLLLQVLIVAFDPPAELCKIDEVFERRRLGQGRKPVSGGLAIALRPFDQEPFDRMRADRS